MGDIIQGALVNWEGGEGSRCAQEAIERDNRGK